MIELIVSDLDDTLLNPSGDISPRTMRALHAAMQAGARVTFATGRMLESTAFFAGELGINAPLILYNGAMVYDLPASRVVSQSPIDAKLAREICRFGEDMGAHMQYYPGEGFLCAQRNEFAQNYSNSVRVRAHTTPGGMPLSAYIQSDAIKLLCIGRCEDMPAQLEKFREAFPSGVNFFVSRPMYIEIVSADANKETTLARLMASLRIEPENMLAFGDGENDIGMLRLAGHSCAVANANKAVRSAAGRVVPTNAEDGVAQVLEELLAAGQIGRRQP